MTFPRAVRPRIWVRNVPTSTCPVLQNIRSAEDRSGVVSVAVVRIDLGLRETGGCLSIDGRKEEGADKNGRGQHGVERHM